MDGLQKRGRPSIREIRAERFCYEEINENLRYVREQLAVQREAHVQAADEFAKYNHPERLTPYEVLNQITKRW